MLIYTQLVSDPKGPLGQHAFRPWREEMYFLTQIIFRAIQFQQHVTGSTQDLSAEDVTHVQVRDDTRVHWLKSPTRARGLLGTARGPDPERMWERHGSQAATAFLCEQHLVFLG